MLNWGLVIGTELIGKEGQFEDSVIERHEFERQRLKLRKLGTFNCPYGAINWDQRRYLALKSLVSVVNVLIDTALPLAVAD